MGTYIIRRLLLVIPTVLLVSFIVFFTIRLIPGSILDLMLEESAVFSDTSEASLKQALGLDVPLMHQYGRWLGVVPSADGSFNGIFQGDLGDSLWRHVEVTEEISDRWPVTVELSILSLLVMLTISLPIGVYSAVRQDTGGDYVGRSLATLLIALPNFWVGIMVILAGSIWFGVSPLLSAVPFMEDPIGNLRQFIIPSLVLGMTGTGTTMRMTRSMMLEVLRQDYIRTAWAKGLRERVVVLRHALKNALIPVVTLIGLRLRTMIGGTVIIETVFSLPGLGRLLVDGTYVRDYTIVSGVIFVYAIALVLINLAVDVTYGYLDPRIRYK